jgi:hypothetical protein
MNIVVALTQVAFNKEIKLDGRGAKIGVPQQRNFYVLIASISAAMHIIN